MTHSKGTERKAYRRPVVQRFGSLSSLTLGMGGSCPDGGGLAASTQLGGAGTCGVSGAARARR